MFVCDSNRDFMREQCAKCISTTQFLSCMCCSCLFSFPFLSFSIRVVVRAAFFLFLKKISSSLFRLLLSLIVSHCTSSFLLFCSFRSRFKGIWERTAQK